jgi:hypothetical protein
MTVAEAGWAGAKNGDLLQRAAGQFDLLLTVDTNLEYQQNFAGLALAVIVVRGRARASKSARSHFSKGLRPVLQDPCGRWPPRQFNARPTKRVVCKLRHEHLWASMRRFNSWVTPILRRGARG